MAPTIVTDTFARRAPTIMQCAFRAYCYYGRQDGSEGVDFAICFTSAGRHLLRHAVAILVGKKTQCIHSPGVRVARLDRGVSAL
jgi:hypothetical protein